MATAVRWIGRIASAWPFSMAQYSYAVGWWSRAAAQMLTLNSALLKGQADVLRPIHKTAVANAKRLKK